MKTQPGFLTRATPTKGQTSWTKSWQFGTETQDLKALLTNCLSSWYNDNWTFFSLKNDKFGIL